MVSGYHFLPVAPASWRKTMPAAAVTSVNCRSLGGPRGGTMAVTCGAGLVDSCGFWESLHALASRARHTALPTNPRRTMLLRCLVEMTGRIMPISDLLPQRLLGLALGHSLRTAGVEAAASGRIQGTWHITAEQDAGLGDTGPGGGHRREQGLRVGVQGMGKEFIRSGPLDDFSQIHHEHTGADVTDDTEIVGNKQKGQPELCLNALQKVNDLRLDRDIER